MTAVFVVSQHCEGSGGFWWFWTSADADEAFDREVETWIGAGSASTIRLVAYEAEYVPARDDQPGRDALTAEIDANLDLVEIELPAIREEKVS